MDAVSDTLNLFSHYFDPSPPNLTAMNNFSVLVFSNYPSGSTPWFGPAGLLGMGPSSTLLKRLFDLQLIPSRSFGLYMGTAYPAAAGVMNGSITLGGYDSGRFTDEVHNYSISPAGASPFQVQVQQMTLISADGKVTDLVDSSFGAYITTSQYELTLPVTVTQKFADSTGAIPDDGDSKSVLLRLPEDFNASLTITLDDGLSITYPSSWLKNVSSKTPISAAPLSSNTTSSQPSLLGSAFLSSLYLIANYDSNTFHLAPALPAAPYVTKQPLCANDSNPTPARQPKISHFAATGLTGAIVAGVIGGTALTLVLLWALRRLLQWCMRNRVKSENKTKELDCEGSPPVPASGRSRKSNKTPSPPSLNQVGSEMKTFEFILSPRNDPNSQSQSQTYSYSLYSENVPMTAPLTPMTAVPLLDNCRTDTNPNPSATTQSSNRRPNVYVQTQFAPPPSRLAGGKKSKGPKSTSTSTAHSMLTKVFPPPARR